MNPMNYNRRAFLKAGVALAATPWTNVWAQPIVIGKDPKVQRTLILLELKGGNDGLSTVIPLQDPLYLKFRTNALVEPKDAIRLDPTHGLNPNLKSFARIFNEGNMAIIESVGLPNRVRSHFRATDIWHSANLEKAGAAPGWIASLGDLAWRKRGSEAVVHFGRDPLNAHRSATRSFLAIENPAHFALLGAGPENFEKAKPKGKARRHKLGSGQASALERIREIQDSARHESLRIRAATAGYRTSVVYPKTPLGSNLRDIAALMNIPVGAPPRVLSTTSGGFDTHSRQKNPHDRLMTGLDEALGAFMQDLARTPIGRNAVVLAYSEFGRRVQENGSQGTDHGKGGPSFVFGHNITGGIFGQAPNLADLDDGDVKYSTDFRSLYSTLIEDLFDCDSKRVLGAKIPKLGFLS
ncbi:MAG: DUF1501 domain-containing protein [Planctomycetes bacterium]|nr:DUF1501 domain-containing protein [Planctomycetota bacterium]